jgi:SSS family solute:Na+ symporter
MNQSMVQRGFGARSEWDVRIAVILVGFAVFFRPFIEILPGMMARALFLAGVRPEFALQGKTVDDVYPLIIRTLVKPGLKGIVLCGVLSAVLAAISALLGSISTLLTFDVYKRWLRKTAGDRELVRVGVVATLLLMVFAVVYAPIVERLGGIFIYFQTTATLLAVPVATVFLFGIFWRRATPAAALATLLVGIPSGFLLMVLLGAVGFGRQETPWLYERLPGLIGFLHAHLPLADPAWLKSWGLDNFFVESGINQAMLCVLMVAVSLATRPRPLAEIRPLLWTKEVLFLPKDEPKRPLWQSVGLWWVVFASFYLVLIFCLW